jgi:hypothetical protein
VKKLVGQSAETIVYDDKLPKRNPDGTYGRPAWAEVLGISQKDVERLKANAKANLKDASRAKRKVVPSPPQVVAIFNKFVDVHFHPGLGRGTIRGDVTDVKSHQGHIQRIKVSEGGYMHDIEMHDIKSVNDATTGVELWPINAFTRPNACVVAGARVHIGDEVEVTVSTGRTYSGIVTGFDQLAKGDMILEKKGHGQVSVPRDYVTKIYIKPRPQFAQGGVVKQGNPFGYNTIHDCFETRVSQDDLPDALLAFKDHIISKLVRNAIAKVIADIPER